MKQAKIHSYFGEWVVSTGETLFPKMFKTKKEAMQVAKQINERENK